mmetsp:Transcript_4452/g.11735  ORF Transcript_4452/g.11735 Transcript_4452/m.11735 type:complete len:104 (-) Transcript_4452:1242-1553(-)
MYLSVSMLVSLGYGVQHLTDRQSVFTHIDTDTTHIHGGHGSAHPRHKFATPMRKPLTPHSLRADSEKISRAFHRFFLFFLLLLWPRLVISVSLVALVLLFLQK